MRALAHQRRVHRYVLPPNLLTCQHTDEFVCSCVQQLGLLDQRYPDGIVHGMHRLLCLETTLRPANVAIQVQYGQTGTGDQSSVACLPRRGLCYGVLPAATLTSLDPSKYELVKSGIQYDCHLGCGVLLCMGTPSLCGAC